MVSQFVVLFDGLEEAIGNLLGNMAAGAAMSSSARFASPQDTTILAYQAPSRRIGISVNVFADKSAEDGVCRVRFIHKRESAGLRQSVLKLLPNKVCGLRCTK